MNVECMSKFGILLDFGASNPYVLRRIATVRLSIRLVDT